jgi:hypothetical protein
MESDLGFARLGHGYLLGVLRSETQGLSDDFPYII